MQDFYPHEVMPLHVVLALYRFCFGGPRDLGWLDFEGEEGGCNPDGDLTGLTVSPSDMLSHWGGPLSLKNWC